MDLFKFILINSIGGGVKKRKKEKGRKENIFGEKNKKFKMLMDIMRKGECVE